MVAERSNYQILVVEDTPPMAKLTMMTLTRSGFQPTHAEDGEAAIAYLEQNQPHLVLLDLNLPGISGWDVMDYIVERFGADAVRVIVTTAYGDTANRVVGKLHAVYKYMVKPFAPHDLISAVDEALEVFQ